MLDMTDAIKESFTLVDHAGFEEKFEEKTPSCRQAPQNEENGDKAVSKGLGGMNMALSKLKRGVTKVMTVNKFKPKKKVSPLMRQLIWMATRDKNLELVEKF